MAVAGRDVQTPFENTGSIRLEQPRIASMDGDERFRDRPVRPLRHLSTGLMKLAPKPAATRDHPSLSPSYRRLPKPRIGPMACFPGVRLAPERGRVTTLCPPSKPRVQCAHLDQLRGALMRRLEMRDEVRRPRKARERWAGENEQARTPRQEDAFRPRGSPLRPPALECVGRRVRHASSMRMPVPLAVSRAEGGLISPDVARREGARAILSIATPTTDCADAARHPLV